MKKLVIPCARFLRTIVDPPFRLAREDRDAEVERSLNVGRDVWQHRQAAADVEAADAHGNARLAERPRDVDGARELIALDADEPDQAPAARLADRGDHPIRPHPCVGLVERQPVHARQ